MQDTRSKILVSGIWYQDTDQGNVLVLTKGRAGEFTKHPKFLKKMKNYLSAVGIVTGVLILFITLIQFNVAYSLIWAIFLAGPFLVLWMVWAVLAAPVEVKETFEEQWYQDR